MLGTPPPARHRHGSIRRLVAVTSLALALVAPAPVLAATSTTIGMSVAQGTIVAGGTASITATVSPNPGGGTVAFTDSLFGLLGTAPIDPETGAAAIGPTLAPGTHAIVATFSGFGDFGSSTGGPVTITVTLGTVGGTTTTTSLLLVTPNPTEGDIVELRATVSPIPDDGRVQFMDGNELLGTSPLDLGTGQASLTTSVLTIGLHRVVAIFNGSTAFSASASPATAVVIGADRTVQAEGVSVSHATIYPIVDGVGDEVSIRGRTFERTSITVVIVNAAGKRVRAIGLGTRIGAYSTTWDGRTSSGKQVPDGRYTVVQSLTDLRGNRLVVSTPLTVSSRRLIRITETESRRGSAFNRQGAVGFGLVIPRESDESVHVWGNIEPDSAFVAYDFTLPAARTYRTIRFEVVGEAQHGRTGAVISIRNWSGSPDWTARAGSANGRTSVTASGPDAVSTARRVEARVTAVGSDGGALRVFSVRLVYSYDVFR